MTLVERNYSSVCYSHLGWWPFLTFSVGLYLTGLAVLLSFTFVLQQGLAKWLFNFRMQFRRKLTNLIIPLDTIAGKSIFIVTLTANMAYITLALFRTTKPVFICVTMATTLIFLMELMVTLILLVYSIMRLLAATNPLIHWFSLLNIVDILTLLHPLISLCVGYDWLGLRTLRFLWLTETARLLKILPCTNSEDIVKVGKILCRFLGMWLAASGLIQLFECSGDPWDITQQPLTFWTSAYFTIVTLSTVGYGDITLTTVCGRIFVTFFIISGMVIYAVAIPTLLDIILSYYHTSQFRRHNLAPQLGQLLIVCGHITPESVNSFLKELLHPDKEDKQTYVLFLHPQYPSQELRQVLKRYYTRVQYFMGSPLSTKDLYASHLHEAKSLVVLANRQSLDYLDEDRANILRVVSVKNTCASTVVILQLLSHYSKDMLASVPGWNPSSDVVICLNELKMSILAQTCVTPGFCTFISNLFFATTLLQMRMCTSMQLSWRQLYITGACNEIYSAPLSQTFIGLKVSRVACICFEKLGLTLLAVGHKDSHLFTTQVIQECAVGYFMADKAQEVLLAQIYCRQCHSEITNRRHIRACSCQPSPHLIPPTFSFNPLPITSTPIPPPVSHSYLSSYGTPPPNIEDPCLPPCPLWEHIVVCIFTSDQSKITGLSCFLKPLRSLSSLPIVIVTHPNYFRREWVTLSDHTQIYCVPGSPLDWECLQQASIENSKICVILTAPISLKESR